LGIAIFLVEQAPHYIARPVGFLVELLAAIPSVVYGLWGIFVLAPFLRQYVEPALAATMVGWLPLFRGRSPESDC
jgi:phosphate transport system permease protein